jgi:acyl-CoA thioesterase
MGRFATDTAVTPLGDGRYAGRVDDGWLIHNPNGGYLPAIVLRAVLAEVDDPTRRPRSVTLHYLRPGRVGPCEVVVTLERTGRGLSTATARFVQDGKDAILAIVALGIDRPGPDLDHHPMPDVPRPEDLVDEGVGPEMTFRERFEHRRVLGPPPMGRTAGEEALTGGWIRLDDDEPLDDVAVLMLCDAWPPAIFTALEVPTGVPTIDLTVHLRHRPEPVPGWCFVRFRTSLVEGGYLEEDGEVWSAEGHLLAQSRQLAIAVAPS